MSLVVSGVNFTYGLQQVLSEVAFRADPGVTAVLGVNGAGKSTMLAVCAGILPPGSGTVQVSSRSPYRRSERKEALRRVSLMPQQAVFPASLTAHDVVSYLGWLKGLTGRAAAVRARECLTSVGLESVMHRRCGTLSGGMVRRVALAQALVSHPEVILLDEPSTGLDPRQRRTMVELIRGLTGTVVLSSHVVEDVEDLAQRVIVVDDGRVVFDGDLDGLTAGVSERGRGNRVEAGFLRAIGREDEL